MQPDNQNLQFYVVVFDQGIVGASARHPEVFPVKNPPAGLVGAVYTPKAEELLRFMVESGSFGEARSVGPAFDSEQIFIQFSGDVKELLRKAALLAGEAEGGGPLSADNHLMREVERAIENDAISGCDPTALERQLFRLVQSAVPGAPILLGRALGAYGRSSDPPNAELLQGALDAYALAAQKEPQSVTLKDRLDAVGIQWYLQGALSALPLWGEACEMAEIGQEPELGKFFKETLLPALEEEPPEVLRKYLRETLNHRAGCCLREMVTSPAALKATLLPSTPAGKTTLSLAAVAIAALVVVPPGFRVLALVGVACLVAFVALLAKAAARLRRRS